VLKANVETELIKWSHGEIVCYWRPGVDTPIILLHGICGGARHFDDIFFDSSLCSNSLLSIDLPGYGYSTPIFSWDLDIVCEAIKAAIGFFINSKPWIVAHSISSSVAVRLIKYISGIILLEGNILSQHLYFSDKVLKSKRHEYNKEYERIQRSSSMVLKYQTHIDDAKLDYYSSTYGLCDYETVWSTASHCNKDIRNFEVVNRLSNWPNPVHCIYGEYSDYKITIDDIKNALPNVKLHAIKNSGHFPMIDNPVDTWLTVANILKREVECC